MWPTWDVPRSPGDQPVRPLLAAPPGDRHARPGPARSWADEADDDDGPPLPPPPPLGSSRPVRLVDALASRSKDAAQAQARALPPPPPLGSSRPERVAGHRMDDDSPRSDGRSSSPGGGQGARRRSRSPRERGKPSPERVHVPLPPPPLVGSSRPVRVTYRLESDSSRSSRSSSPAEIMGPPRRRSPSRSNDGKRRRRSPPRRSPSPDPPKRPRRDDGAGRRSPPRGGRYERGGDGGRLAGHRAPDGPNSGYGASSKVQNITQRKGLMTYKQFILALEDDISPAEAESRYQEYKTAYITTQKHAYFDLHKDDTRLKEKYHPTSLLSVIERRNEFCKAAAKSLILDLRSGTLDLGPGMTADGSSKSGNDNCGSSGNGEDYGNKRRKNGRGPPKESGPLSTAPKAHPVSSKYRRIQTDIDQTLALVRKLDSEKGIVGNILSIGGDHGKPDDDRSHVGSAGPLVIIRGLTTVKGLDGVELLDTLLTYLWRVHGVDYYGMSERRNANGFRHVRADNKSADAFNISAADWEKKLDSFWHERLVNGEDPLVVLTAKDKIDAATVEALAPYVKKIMDENYGYKYGCGAMGCTKVFHAPEFVHKHLKLKHPDLVSVLTLSVQDDIYFQNYMNDPNAPGGKPVMQKSEQDSGRMRRIPDEQGSDAPLIPDAPPTVLVPLPGAGPLGPFVPIPPDMAVQMMREQRPPRPNGAQHKKKPLMPEPMMPMYPHFPLDPRPLRRYNDLDAPEEEVTAIDYRSV
ncbi:hypothetical protein CFC21_087350 [Triticum aestivum]|uniref:C2H2-type domain-containing protein n=2 Tax=Triticum aestivum TaxID=4565 RepID=A0A9R1LAL8_WHEAT|nr:serrate RNA effector molecule-like [Triticum aestivum]KAF7083574.1 hypothetical protein CFC21_087350 [Triticum aestivum]